MEIGHVRTLADRTRTLTKTDYCISSRGMRARGGRATDQQLFCALTSFGQSYPRAPTVLRDELDAGFL